MHTYLGMCAHVCNRHNGDLQAQARAGRPPGLRTQHAGTAALLQLCVLEPALRVPLRPLRTEQLWEAPTGRPLGRVPFVGSDSPPRAPRRSPARGVLWEDDSNHVNVQTLPIFPIGYKQERTPCTRHKGSCKDTRGGRACVLSPSLMAHRHLARLPRHPLLKQAQWLYLISALR